MTRDELARIVDYDPRHLQAIENEGQKTSLELFIQLVTMFGVSVDEYILVFLICNECGDAASGEKWEQKIDGMTVYTGEQLKALLEQTGFCGIQIHRNQKGWLCVTGQKPEK